MTPSDHPEIAWIRAYNHGDVAALGHLVEHFRRPLFAFIHNMLQGRGDPEELFQEVWLRAIRNLPRFQEKNFAGWLFRIAHNLFIDEVRRTKRDPLPLDAPPPGAESPLHERLASPDPTPARLVADADLADRITAALATLPEDQRAVFLMRTEADLPFKEIAAIQKTTLNTALSRMQYALQKMRPLLQEEYDLLAQESRHEATPVR